MRLNKKEENPTLNLIKQKMKNSGNIAKLRGKKTQDQFAKENFRSRGTINLWENGNAIPDIDVLYDLKMKYNVSIDYLLGLSDCTTPTNDYIQQVTGLSDKALKMLKMISESDHTEDSYSEYYNQTMQTVSLINLVLESMYDSQEAYKTKKDFIPDSIFSLMYAYIYSNNLTGYYEADIGKIGSKETYQTKLPLKDNMVYGEIGHTLIPQSFSKLFQSALLDDIHKSLDTYSKDKNKKPYRHYLPDPAFEVDNRPAEEIIKDIDTAHSKSRKSTGKKGGKKN